MFAFEEDWESGLRDPWSIEPMLRTLQAIGELKCIRRNVATVPELEHYLEIWHNRQRRHSSLGMLTPVEFESRHQHKPAA